MLILALVMAVGFWGKDAKPVTLPANPIPKQEQPKPAAQQPGPTMPPAQQKQTTPAVETKPAQPPVAAQRQHIDRSGGAANTMLVTVYYADETTGDASLQPVQVRVAQTKELVETVARLVVAAPTDLMLQSSVPAGTKVVSVNLKDKVAIVDLSAEASNVRGTRAAQNMRASFVYSLTSINGVEAVELRVNGRPAKLDQLEWSQPITRKQLDDLGGYKVEPVIKFVP